MRYFEVYGGSKWWWECDTCFQLTIYAEQLRALGEAIEGALVNEG